VFKKRNVNRRTVEWDDVQKRILIFLADHPGEFTSGEIAKALDLPEDVVLKALNG
jgi:hypothetical protein